MFCPANVESGENMGDRVEGLPEQFVGNTGHRHSAALALAIKRADYVVGEARGVEVPGHKIGS